MEQALSVAGAFLILAAYTLHQFGRLDRTRAAYVGMNFVGALILTVIAWRAELWGFVLLEGAWAVMSVAPLARRPRAGPSSPA